jgi:hypothetical protein
LSAKWLIFIIQSKKFEYFKKYGIIRKIIIFDQKYMENNSGNTFQEDATFQNSEVLHLQQKTAA